MKYELELEHPVIGLAAESTRTGPDGGTVRVIMQNFLSTEDGQPFIQQLEELSKIFLHAGPHPRIPESQIDHLLILTQGNRATVYVNEVGLILHVQSRGTVQVGDPVYVDSFADVVGLEPKDLTIPDDVGYVFVFSVGWRKGLLFDFSPLSPEQGQPAGPRDLRKVFGSAYAYVSFQERFALEDSQWHWLIEQQWFPFIGLSGALINELLAHVQAGWDVDGLLPKFSEELQKGLPMLQAQLSTSKPLAGHAAVVKSALDAFGRKDWVAVSALLLPRIEGVIRSHHAREGGAKPNQKDLAKIAVSDPAGRRHDHSLLLPARFEEYLVKVYLAGEDFADPSKVRLVTRHSAAHGVAPEHLLDEKRAVLSVLILRQLMFLLSG